MLAISRIVKTHPFLVAEYEELILDSLDDGDLLIRQRALEVISLMATKRNVGHIIEKLLNQIISNNNDNQDGDMNFYQVSKYYKRLVCQHIIDICTRNNYETIPSYNWLLELIMTLGNLTPSTKNDQLGNKLMQTYVDITLNMTGMKEYSIGLMNNLLLDYINSQSNEDTIINNNLIICSIYLCGTFSIDLKNYEILIKNLVNFSLTFNNFNSLVKGLCVQSSAKIFAIYAMIIANEWNDNEGDEGKEENLNNLRKIFDICECVNENLDNFLNDSNSNLDVDVEERVIGYKQLLNVMMSELNIKIVNKNETNECPKSLYLLSSLYINANENNEEDEEIDLNLNEWIFESESKDINESEDEERKIIKKSEKKEKKKRKEKQSESHDKGNNDEQQVKIKKNKEKRYEEIKHNPYYLKNDNNTNNNNNNNELDELDDIPIVKLNNNDSSLSLLKDQNLKSNPTTTNPELELENEPRAIESGNVSKVVKKKKSTK